VDRFLVTAEAYHIPALIVINKIDLLREEDLETLATWQEQYSEAGYKVVTLSAFEEDSIRDLRTLIDNRKTLFSGHSGVGKSTIINALIPGLDIRTTEISDKSGKGQHTTTFAEMHDLPEGGQIIDTPGVKEFGLIDVKQEELAHYFPEMRKRINQCKFNNCIHVNEPGCAIKEAVDNHKLSVNRYINYLSILESIEVKW
jgi:ribosome biogenesis GTPase